MDNVDRERETKLVTGKAFLVAATAFGVAMSGAPALAQPAKAVAVDAKARDRATNQKILANLLQRRAEIVATPGHFEAKRSALRFLDRQIARVKADLAA